MNNEQIKVTLERIRDILLMNGTAQENLDNVCDQIDDVLQKMMAELG